MSLITETSQKADLTSWIEIRQDRFLENLKHIRNINGAPHAMAVIKANAYGHGLLDMARALKDSVTYLGVSSLQEILELKEHGIETPVFFFGHLFGKELRTAAKAGATLSISSYEAAQEIAQAAHQIKQTVKVHVKVDTGMGRMGIPVADALETIQKIAALKGLTLEGIYTHFPNAEKDDGFMESQFRKFEILIEDLQRKGISFLYRHAANSAASLKLKASTLNLIRPGLILYGILPVQSISLQQMFQPVLSLKSRIILLKRLHAGDSVGYGREFIAKEPCTIATLPIGYSHGYPVHLSGKSFAIYRGKRYPIAGRVSMDYISLNLGNTPAAIGDEITLLGEDNGEIIRAEEIAQWAGTISYEIVTRLSSRLPRLYHA